MSVARSFGIKTLKELRDRVLDDKVAQQVYGNRVTAILGTKGTAFLEDTGAFGEGFLL